jgi:hypothetical protein
LRLPRVEERTFIDVITTSRLCGKQRSSSTDLLCALPWDRHAPACHRPWRDDQGRL